MRPFKRSLRLETEIQRILAVALREEAEDPRIKDINIVEVKVSDDLKKADVYFTTLKDVKEVLEGLKRAKGFLRTILAHKLTMRRIPDIVFSPFDIKRFEKE